MFLYHLVSPVISDRDVAERPLKVKPKAPPLFSKKYANGVADADEKIVLSSERITDIPAVPEDIGDPKTYFQSLQREGMLLQAQGKGDEAVPILFKVK